MTLRQAIADSLNAANGNVDEAATAICLLLEDWIGLDCYGWFDDDEHMLQALAKRKARTETERPDLDHTYECLELTEPTPPIDAIASFGESERPVSATEPEFRAGGFAGVSANTITAPSRSEMSAALVTPSLLGSFESQRAPLAFRSSEGHASALGDPL